MRDHDLRVCLQARLDAARLPIPKHDIAIAVPTADPLAVRREADLARITHHTVPREAFLAVLSEVVCAVDEDLVVERLRGEVFFYAAIGLARAKGNEG